MEILWIISKIFPSVISCQLYVIESFFNAHPLMSVLQLHQVSAGMLFLHANGIIHANLKPVLATTSSFDHVSDKLSREISLFMKIIALWCKTMK